MSLALKFWHVCYKWNLLVRSKTLGKITFFWKKLFFSSWMRTLKIKFSDFGFEVSAGLSKVQLTCPLKLFSEDAVFSEIHNLFWAFSVLIQAFRTVSGFIVGNLSKLLVMCPNQPFEENLSQWKILNLFSTIFELERQDFGLRRF